MQPFHLHHLWSLPYRPWRRRTSGFTLIELLMTLAVLSVMLALGAPAYGKLIGRTRAQTAGTELATALNQARNGAVSRGLHVVVCPSEDQVRCDRTTQWHHGWLAFADLDHDRERSADEPVLAVALARPAGVAIVSTAGRMRIDYQPDGSAAGTNATLTVCDRAAGGERARAFLVNNAGRVRSGVPAADATAACLRAAG